MRRFHQLAEDLDLFVPSLSHSCADYGMRLPVARDFTSSSVPLEPLMRDHAQFGGRRGTASDENRRRQRQLCGWRKCSRQIAFDRLE